MIASYIQIVDHRQPSVSVSDHSTVYLAPLYPHRTLWRYTNVVLLLLLLLLLEHSI